MKRVIDRPRQVLVLAFVALLVTACASASPSRALRSEFEDIPVPKGLNYCESKSIIIESPSVKAARLLYRGRVEITSLTTAMRATLEANGWRQVSSATTQDQGTIQVYEKSGNSLQTRLWEGFWFTYVELIASRALGPPR